MKKLVIPVLAMIFVLVLFGCGSDGIDRATPVFDTDNISRITFFTPTNYEDGIDVPSEHMDEIVSWLGTFRIGTKAGDTLIPGTNSISLQIVYADGTILEHGLSTATVDGSVYYMDSESAPPCYFEIIEAD